MKKIRAIIILLALISVSTAFTIINNSFTAPHDNDKINYVPNDSTAIKIAEAVWLPIYGKEIEKKKPFKAKLINDTIWRVESSSPYMHGDVYAIKINKRNGTIYYVAHEK